MVLLVKGCANSPVKIHGVSRIWFEDGRVWYCKDGTDTRLPYTYRLLEILKGDSENGEKRNDLETRSSF